MKSLKEFLLCEARIDIKSGGDYQRIKDTFEYVETFGDYILAVDAYYNNTTPKSGTEKNLKDLFINGSAFIKNQLFNGWSDTKWLISLAYYNEEDKIKNDEALKKFIIDHRNDEIDRMIIFQEDRYSHRDTSIKIKGWKRELSIFILKDMSTR